MCVQCIVHCISNDYMQCQLMTRHSLPSIIIVEYSESTRCYGKDVHIHYILLDKMQGHIRVTLGLHLKGESFLAVPFWYGKKSWAFYPLTLYVVLKNQLREFNNVSVHWKTELVDLSWVCRSCLIFIDFRETAERI